jgi:hypothetical protein
MPSRRSIRLSAGCTMMKSTRAKNHRWKGEARLRPKWLRRRLGEGVPSSSDSEVRYAADEAAWRCPKAIGGSQSAHKWLKSGSQSLETVSPYQADSCLRIRIPRSAFHLSLLTRTHTENRRLDRDRQERPRYGMKSAISGLHRCSRTRLVERRNWRKYWIRRMDPNTIARRFR